MCISQYLGTFPSSVKNRLMFKISLIARCTSNAILATFILFLWNWISNVIQGICSSRILHSVLTNIVTLSVIPSKKLTRSQATYHTVSVYNFQMIGIFSRPICPPHVPICDLLVAINLSSTLGCEFLYGVFLTVVGASFIKRHPVKAQCFTSLTSLLITEPPCHSNIKLICDS